MRFLHGGGLSSLDHVLLLIPASQGPPYHSHAIEFHRTSRSTGPTATRRGHGQFLARCPRDLCSKSGIISPWVWAMESTERRGYARVHRTVSWAGCCIIYDRRHGPHFCGEVRRASLLTGFVDDAPTTSPSHDPSTSVTPLALAWNALRRVAGSTVCSATQAKKSRTFPVE
ncbi:hypothetical protein C8Q73DRAFT_429975 [Cubamyces lactineus]|nr:hypothetical protein C8Q73DRAFT_429975 [Cubamyces lactineus]